MLGMTNKKKTAMGGIGIAVLLTLLMALTPMTGLVGNPIDDSVMAAEQNQVAEDDAFAQPRRHDEPLVAIEVYGRRQRQAVATPFPGLAQPELLGCLRAHGERARGLEDDGCGACEAAEDWELSHCLSHATAVPPMFPRPLVDQI